MTMSRFGYGTSSSFPDPYDGSANGNIAVAVPPEEQFGNQPDDRRTPDQSVVVDRTTAFLFHVGRAYPSLERWAMRHKGSFLAKKIRTLAVYLEYQRNPRSRSYMEELVHAFFPNRQNKILDVNRSPVQLDWDAMDCIVLLWPDGNGTGWANIEREIFRRKKTTAKVLVLNGRRRLFELDAGRWRAIKWRRALEKTLVLEMGLVVIFFVTGSALALWDFLTQRRG
jgi:hypothetical protein